MTRTLRRPRRVRKIVAMNRDHLTHAETCPVDDDLDLDAPTLVRSVGGDGTPRLHRGRAVVVDAGGHIRAKWGDSSAPAHFGAALGPLRAVSLVEAGAFDVFDPVDADLAIALGPHRGSPEHAALVADRLRRIGLGPGDLECPPGNLSALDHPRSGEHAGLLAAARGRGERTRSYARPEHPAQQRLIGVLERMTGVDVFRSAISTADGGLPDFALPPEVVAHATAAFLDEERAPERQIRAARRVLAAWRDRARLIGETPGAIEFELPRASDGAILVAVGAAGAGLLWVPDRGIAAAVVIPDAPVVARDAALIAAARGIGLLDDRTADAVARAVDPSGAILSTRDLSGASGSPRDDDRF